MSPVPNSKRAKISPVEVDDSKAKADARAAFFRNGRAMIMKHYASKAAAAAAAAASSSSTASAAAKAEEKPSSAPPPQTKSEIEALKEKHNSDGQIKPKPKPAWVQTSDSYDSPVVGVYSPDKKGLNLLVYDSENPLFRNSVAPSYVKQYCTLALKKYNKEEGTNYRNVRPLQAHEGGNPRDTSIFLVIFRASQSAGSDSDTFAANITSSSTTEVEKVYRVRDLSQVVW